MKIDDVTVKVEIVREHITRTPTHCAICIQATTPERRYSSREEFQLCDVESLFDHCLCRAIERLKAELMRSAEKTGQAKRETFSGSEG